MNLVQRNFRSLRPHHAIVLCSCTCIGTCIGTCICACICALDSHIKPHAVTKATITMKEAPVIDVAPLRRGSSKHHFRLGLLTSTKFAKRDLCFSALDHIAADTSHNDTLWPIFIAGILDAPAVMEDFVRRCSDVSRAIFIDVLCPRLTPC